MKNNLKTWLDSIKWDNACIECKAEHDGECRDIICARANYDEWGDPIPAWTYFPDGSLLDKYLEEKRKKIEDDKEKQVQ